MARTHPGMSRLGVVKNFGGNAQLAILRILQRQSIVQSSSSLLVALSVLDISLIKKNHFSHNVLT